MIKLFFTLVFTLTALSSLQANDTLKQQHQDDLAQYRAIKEKIATYDESTQILKRDTKLARRNHKVQTQTAVADLRSVELKRRAQQYNRRNHLQKRY